MIQKFEEDKSTIDISKINVNGYIEEINMSDNSENKNDIYDSNIDEESNREELIKNGFRTGKWDKDEHYRFLQACEKYGNSWTKIQYELKTRSAAQIRSHAQKFIIKLCKKYQIKIKSKKFKKNKLSKHLEYINKSKYYDPSVQPVEINKLEKKLIDTFNYYHREYKPFAIEKRHRDHENYNCVRHLDNKKTQEKLLTQIFSVKKISRNYNSLNNSVNCTSDSNSNEKKNCILSLYESLCSLSEHNNYFFDKLASERYEVQEIQKMMSNYIHNFFVFNEYSNSFQNHLETYNQNSKLIIEYLKGKCLF